MEDSDALNRRTNLPIRMVQDRPKQQKEELLWGEIQEGDEEMKKHEEKTNKIHVLKNYTQTDTEIGTAKNKSKKAIME